MSKDPPPPTERSCQRALFCHLLPELEKTTISSSCPSWKPLFENLCRSMALPLMIHFILSRRSFPIVRTRRPRHFATPPMGLIDLVRRAPPASAPLLLSPSVGPHNERPASPPLLLSPSDNERPASPPLVMSPSDNPQPQSEFYGQLLFEVMAAYSDFPFRGTLFINDGMTLSYIYNRSGRDCRDFFSRKKEWLTRHADSSEKFKNKLRLNGPGGAISALFGFSLFADFPNGREYVACYDDLSDFSSTYNEPKTITIATHIGSLYVTGVLLTDAVRAKLEVKVRLPWDDIWVYAHGHVTAYIGTFEIGTTIFSRDDYEELADNPDGREFSLPLDRSVLAVPIGSCLHIKGQLTLLAWMKPISIDHSIPTESDFFETGWDEDEGEELEIKTAVSLALSDVWI